MHHVCVLQRRRYGDHADHTDVIGWTRSCAQWTHDSSGRSKLNPWMHGHVPIRQLSLEKISLALHALGLEFLFWGFSLGLAQLASDLMNLC
jgi:hypothetical protein